MKIRPLLLCSLIVMFGSCQKKNYKSIRSYEVKLMTILDTLVNTSDLVVMKVGKSSTDAYPKLLVESDGFYLFDYDCQLESDSTILAYYDAFLIDDEGAFRKNGLWIHTNYKKEGIFPFISKSIHFGVDSIPKNWKGKLPKKEGIYFYEGNVLKRMASEQSEEQFYAKERNGFYFLPNTGRLFTRIYLKELN